MFPKFLRAFFWLAVATLAFLLQCCFFARIPFLSVCPNLLLASCAAFGFMRGEGEGIMMGTLCGLLMDVFFSPVIGFYTMLFMLAGYANGKLNAYFYPANLWLVIASVSCSDFFIGLIQYAIFFLLRGRFHFLWYLGHIILPETVFTLIAALIHYPLLLFVNLRLEEMEIKEARKFV